MLDSKKKIPAGAGDKLSSIVLFMIFQIIKIEVFFTITTHCKKTPSPIPTQLNTTTYLLNGIGLTKKSMTFEFFPN